MKSGTGEAISMNYAAEWKISEEHKQTMSSFMTDYWQLIKASYEIPADTDPSHDHYWKTLVYWCDALMKKYNGDPVINRIVAGYLDGQSDKACCRPVNQMTFEEYCKEARLSDHFGGTGTTLKNSTLGT